MDVRKFKISPEDETRFRELLRIHEAQIDQLTDDELDAAERDTSRQIQQLMQKQGGLRRTASVSRLRVPSRSGALAFIAAAAAVLLIQVQINDSEPTQSRVVSKGTGASQGLSCEASVVESDGTTPDSNSTHYLVRANTSSYLKLHCGLSVFAHIGYMDGETLHLEHRNLTVSSDDKVVTRGVEPLNVTALVQEKAGLVVLVTEQPLAQNDLSPADREGLWLDDLPLTIKGQD